MGPARPIASPRLFFEYLLRCEYMDVVFFGIQGSGKGTQAKKLAQEFGYDIFEAGGELRKIAASGSKLGTTVKSYIDQGHLVPHEIIMDVVAAAIAARPQATKILFDGIPRDQAQMRDFDAIMRRAGRDFIGIHFLLDAQVATQRIVGRAKEQGRADDADPAIIERRMRTFAEKTLPVIQTYAAQQKMREIDASYAPDDVYQALTTVMQRA